MAFNLTGNVILRTPNLPRVVQTIRNSLNSIQANININVSPKTAAQVGNISKLFTNFNATLKQTTPIANNAAVALRNLGAAVNQLKTLGTVNKNVIRQQQNIAAGLGQTAKAAKYTGNMMYQLGESGALALKRFAGFTIATSAVFGFIYAIGNAIKSAIEFESQIIRLSQVMPKTEGNVSKLGNTVRELSINFGIASSELMDVTRTMAQAGLRGQDLERALTAVAKSDLAPTFTDMKNTGEGLIAIFNQFNLESRDFEKALGSINAVAGAFAIESDDLISAVRKTGGVFAAASTGVSDGTDALNEFIAVMTSVRSTTRESADSIATGLRTILTRIQRPRTIEFLKAYGVELQDAEGNFVGAYEAIERLGKGLEGLDQRSTRFMRVGEELGGFRQIGKTLPLLTQTEKRQRALNVAKEGTMSLDKDAAKATQGLGRQIQMVREQFLKLISDVFETQTFKLFAGTILTIARSFLVLADAIKPIIPLIGLLVAQRTISGLISFGQGVGGWYKSHIASMTTKGPGVYGSIASIPTTTSGVLSSLAGRGGFRGNVQLGAPNQNIMLNSLRNQVLQQSGATPNIPNTRNVTSILRPVIADIGRQFKVGTEQYNEAMRAATNSIAKQISTSQPFGHLMRFRASSEGYMAGQQYGRFMPSMGRVAGRFMSPENAGLRGQIGGGLQLGGLVLGGIASSGRGMVRNTLGGAMSGAAIGAMIGQQVIPIPGWGAGIGAAVGGVGGGIAGFRSGKAKEEAYRMELFGKAIQSAINNLNEFAKATGEARDEIAARIVRDIRQISGFEELADEVDNIIQPLQRRPSYTYSGGMGYGTMPTEVLQKQLDERIKEYNQKIEDAVREKLLQTGDIREAVKADVFKRFERGQTATQVATSGAFGGSETLAFFGPDFEKNVQNMAEFKKRVEEIDKARDEEKVKLQEFLDIFKQNVIEDNAQAFRDLYDEMNRVEKIIEEMMGPFQDFGISMRDFGDALDVAIQKNKRLDDVANQLFDRALGGPGSAGKILQTQQANVFKNPFNTPVDELVSALGRVGIGADTMTAQVIKAGKEINDELPKLLAKLDFEGVSAADLPIEIEKMFSPSGDFGKFPDLIRKSMGSGLLGIMQGKSESEYGILGGIIDTGQLKDLVQKFGGSYEDALDKGLTLTDALNMAIESQINLANKRLELEKQSIQSEMQIIQARRGFAEQRREIFGGSQSLQQIKGQRRSDIGQLAGTGISSLTVIRSQLMSAIAEQSRLQQQPQTTDVVAKLESLGSFINRNVLALEKATDVTQQLASINNERLKIERKREAGQNLISLIGNANPLEFINMSQDLIKLAEMQRDAQLGLTPTRSLEDIRAAERALKIIDGFSDALGETAQENVRNLNDLLSGEFLRAMDVGNITGPVGDLLKGATGGLKGDIDRLKDEFDNLAGESVEASKALKELAEAMGKQAKDFADKVGPSMVANLEAAGNKFTDVLGKVSISLTEFGKSIPGVTSIGMNTGGFVGGAGNKDKIPAMLTPGEFVVRKGVAQKNKGMLAAINGGKTQYLNNGGFAGYGSTMLSRDKIIDMLRGESEEVIEKMIQGIHVAAGTQMVELLGGMKKYDEETGKNVLKSMFPGGMAPHQVGGERTAYSPTTGQISIGQQYHESMPVNVLAHEGSHALQHGPGNMGSVDRTTRLYRAGAEIGPTLAGGIADYHARIQGGAKPTDDRVSLTPHYEPSMEFLRQQAEKHGVFSGKPIDELLAKNPQFIKMLAQGYTDKIQTGSAEFPLDEIPMMFDKTKEAQKPKDRELASTSLKEVGESISRTIESVQNAAGYREILTEYRKLRAEGLMKNIEGMREVMSDMEKLRSGTLPAEDMADLEQRVKDRDAAKAKELEKYRVPLKMGEPDPAKVSALHERVGRIPNKAVYDRTRGTSAGAALNLSLGMSPIQRAMGGISTPFTTRRTAAPRMNIATPTPTRTTQVSEPAFSFKEWQEKQSLPKTESDAAKSFREFQERQALPKTESEAAKKFREFQQRQKTEQELAASERAKGPSEARKNFLNWQAAQEMEGRGGFSGAIQRQIEARKAREEKVRQRKLTPDQAFDEVFGPSVGRSGGPSVGGGRATSSTFPPVTGSINELEEIISGFRNAFESGTGGTSPDINRSTENLNRTLQDSVSQTKTSNDYLNKALVDLAEKLGNVNINIPDIVQHQINGEVQVNFMGNHALTQAIAQEVRQIINTQVSNAMAAQVSPLSGETLVG